MTAALDTSRLRRGPSAEFDDLVGDDRVAADDTIARPDAARLIVRRQDIQFIDIGPGRVQIMITVTNAGPSRSQRTPALIQAAALGAFVHWRPLAVLPVPALEAGESALLRTEAQRVILDPLGSIDRLPPGRLLTALGFDEEEPRTGGIRGGLSGTPPTASGALATSEPPGPAHRPEHSLGGEHQRLRRGKGRRAAPGQGIAHLPRARTNVAMFIVGGGPDSYRFDLPGLGPDWDVAIVDPMKAGSLSQGMSDGTPIEPGSWHALCSHSLLFLVLRPPANCREGGVEVHVTQQSTRKTAVVEFSFDPRAVGPGCYVVD